MMPLNQEEKDLLLRALRQDSGRGDLTSCIFDGEEGRGVIIAEEGCILSGIEAVDLLFSELGGRVSFPEGVASGSVCGKGEVVAVVEGLAEGLLRAERIALNVLSRMSGIATMARRASDIAEKISPGTRVAGTRKTTPGFHCLEKRALMDGGALPHRMDLSSMAMLKDNHLKALGGGPDAVLIGVEMIRERYGPYSVIEVEVEDIPSGIEAVEAGADIILLDNFTPDTLPGAADEIRRAADINGKKVVIEASGGITFENLKRFAPHVDVVSMGCLTYGARTVGFNMDYSDRKKPGSIRGPGPLKHL